MKYIAVRCLLVTGVLLFSLIGNPQTVPSYIDTTKPSIDSIIIQSSKCRILHRHINSNYVAWKMLNDKDDSIFTKEYNNFSTLEFKSDYNSFNVSTIPLSSIVYLEYEQLILGLSKISESPYSIVIYSTKGELICKVRIQPYELKFNAKDLKLLIEKYPTLKRYLQKVIVIKDHDSYYVESAPALSKILGGSPLQKLKFYVPNPVVDFDRPSVEGPGLVNYIRFFNDFDPLIELIKVGSVPYLLLLNSEEGKRITIPLNSNCNILSELGYSGL